MKEDTISWQSLYDLEVRTNEAIGCKERFVLLSKISRQLFPSLKFPKILDGGGVVLLPGY